MGGLLQAGPLVELGFPCWKKGTKLACGKLACGNQALSILLMSDVEMAMDPSLWFEDGEKSGTFNPSQSSPSIRKQEDPSMSAGSPV